MSMKTATHRTTKKVTLKRPWLSESEAICLEALKELIKENGGKIPRQAVIIGRMGGIVGKSTLTVILQKLEAKGYIRRRLEVVA